MRRAPIVLWVLASACAPADAGYAYIPCASDADCMGRAACHAIVWRGGSGDLCTATCTGESSCPHSGRCLDVMLSGSFLCYAPCTVDVDCPMSFVCQPVTTGGSVCLPGP